MKTKVCEILQIDIPISKYYETTKLLNDTIFEFNAVPSYIRDALEGTKKSTLREHVLIYAHHQRYQIQNIITTQININKAWAIDSGSLHVRINLHVV